MMTRLQDLGFQSIKPQRIKEVAGASLLWSGVVFTFVRPTTQQVILAQNIGVEQSMMVLAIGLVFSLIIIGFMGGKTNVKALLLTRLVFNLLSTSIIPLASFQVFLSQLTVLYYFLGNVSFPLFIVAWCHFCSGKTESEKQSIVLPSILYSLSLLLVLLHLPFLLAILFSCIFTITGTLCLVLGTKKVKEDIVVSEAPVKQRRVVFIVLGLILGCLMVFCPPFVSRDILALALTITPGEVLWTILVFLIATVFMLYLGAKKRRRAIPSLLVPLLSLGLLVPPFISCGIDAIFPISIIFVVLGGLLVFSSGNPATKIVFSFKGRSFVFWERSIAMLGYGIGAIATAFFITSVQIEVSYSIFIVAAFVYTTICLITISLPEQILEKVSGKKTYALLFDEVSERIAVDFSFTPREKEVFVELAKGRSTPYIQKKLYISEGTALSHISHIHQKLGIHNRQELLDIVQRYFDNERV